MRLVLDVDASMLYERLRDPAERAELERALSWMMMTSVRVAQMTQNGLTWKPGGNGNGRALLTEAQVEAMACPLDG